MMKNFGLILRFRRTPVSIPSNIAEVALRKSNKDFSRFLMIALGSCYELETQLLISFDLGFIQNNTLEKHNTILH